MNGEESFFEDMFIVDTVLESADGGERRDNQKSTQPRAGLLAFGRMILLIVAGLGRDRLFLGDAIGLVR